MNQLLYKKLISLFDGEEWRKILDSFLLVVFLTGNFYSKCFIYIFLIFRLLLTSPLLRPRICVQNEQVSCNLTYWEGYLPVKTLKSNALYVLYSQKYTPPHCFFCIPHGERHRIFFFKLYVYLFIFDRAKILSRADDIRRMLEVKELAKKRKDNNIDVGSDGGSDKSDLSTQSMPQYSSYRYEIITCVGEWIEIYLLRNTKRLFSFYSPSQWFYYFYQQTDY